MRRFIIRLLIFVALMAIVDIAVGCASRYLFCHAKSGDTARMHKIGDIICPDVLFLGSSRCLNHYDDSLLTESLGVNVYNAGVAANGIILNYGLFRRVTERYKPTWVVYEIYPSYDYLAEYDNTKFLKGLRPWWGTGYIDSIFDNVDATERIKMASGMRRVNETFYDMIVDNITATETIYGYQPKGFNKFVPLIPADVTHLPQLSYDSLRIVYLNRLIDDCQNMGIKLAFTQSPYYLFDDATAARSTFIDSLAAARSIPYLKYGDDHRLTGHPEYFSDPYHLNPDGVKLYNNIILNQDLKHLMSK